MMLLQTLQRIHDQHKAVVLTSSLSNEDQLLTHYYCQVTKTPDIVVLDTGRLHPQTYDLMAETEKYYQFRYRVIMPDSNAVESLVATHGINLFYDNVANRKACCYVRKVQPLERALATADAWITGLRREHSPERSQIQEVDKHGTIMKYSPLVAWTESDLIEHMRLHKIPENALYRSGYRSIGCAPCTRAIGADAPVRSGRWWWEETEKKECGLHTT